MKVAILAGGKGSRLAEETQIRPKPMVEIGGYPILWHIMRHYFHYGFKEFVVALGYKGEVIKNYMRAYCENHGNLKVDFGTGEIEFHNAQKLDWSVELIETGQETLTGGRIRQLAPYLGNQTFMLTWGDGVSNVDLNKLVDFHYSHGKLATVTAVRPPARYGHMTFEGDQVIAFEEKSQAQEGWINGAFFVLEPGIFDYIGGNDVMWEHEPMRRLAADGQLMAYKHDSFWQCMDTLREKHMLETLWQSGNCPWKIWNEENEGPRHRHQGYTGGVLTPMLLKRGYDVVGLDSGLFRACLYTGSVPEVPTIRKDIHDVEQGNAEGFVSSATISHPLGAGHFVQPLSRPGGLSASRS